MASDSASSLNLLVVEDNYTDSKILLTFLQDADPSLAVHLVTDGEEAIHFLTRRGCHGNALAPDVVLLDINLPKKNGFEVLAEVRQDPRIAGIPVFILSSTKNPEDIRRGEALNVAGFFSKPTDLSEFEKLAHTLANREFRKYLPVRVDVPDKTTPEAPLAKDGDAQKPVEEQMENRSDEIFRQLVEGVKDYAIFMLDVRGNILTWNEGAKRLKGYTHAEILGKHFSAFYTVEDLNRNHPQNELEIAARTGRFQEEGWRIKKDGARFWASVTITAIKDKKGHLVGFGKVTRDFSDRWEAEKKLRDSERRFRLLVEGVKDYAIFMLNPEGRIVSWNIGAERIKGYKASEIIGQHFSIFYTQDALDKNHPDFELKFAAERGAYGEEGIRRRKDGTTFWASVTLTALYDESGLLQGFAKITRDITARKRSEEEAEKFAHQLEAKVEERTQELEASRERLIEQRDQFERSNRDLQRSNRDLQQFAYVASHDLQEPLRGIGMCLQILREKHGAEQTPEALEYIALAIDGSHRMSDLMQGLLQFARVGQVTKSEAFVDLNQVVRDVVTSLETMIRETGARVEVSELPSVAGDVTQLTQLLQNLIGNAIKYRREHEPAVVRITAEKADKEVILHVQDNGIGIESQYFERIFVIFQRLHGDRNKYPGTGIGLALCKRIVESHNGRLWLESEPGSGSTFSFSLPN